jgi:hypothetical protein
MTKFSILLENFHKFGKKNHDKDIRSEYSFYPAH